MYRSTNIRVLRKRRKAMLLTPRIWTAVAIPMAFGICVSTLRSFPSPSTDSSIPTEARLGAEAKTEPWSPILTVITRGTGSAPPEIEESPGGDFSVDGGFGGRHARPLNTTFLSTRVSGNSNTGRNEPGSRKGMSIARSRTGETRRPGPIERDLSTQ